MSTSKKEKSIRESKAYKSMKNTFLVLAGIAALVFFFWALVTGVNKSEQVECSEWREQAAQFPAWYSTQWQREQCIAHGLPLPR